MKAVSISGHQVRDVNRVPPDGCLVLPLSMGRLSSAQSPKCIHEFLQFFETKLTTFSVDVVLLYTNGLHMNDDEKGPDYRNSSLNLIVQHKAELINIITQNRKYVHRAFHFLPWDYAVVNAAGFADTRTLLLKRLQTDKQFSAHLMNDLNSYRREHTDSNVAFLIEELLITGLIQSRQVQLPHTVSSENAWRLFCYPGKPLQTLSYIHQKKLLQFDERVPLSHAFYDMQDHVMINLMRMAASDNTVDRSDVPMASSTAM